MNNIKKLDTIKKHYKNTDILLEIYLENYHNFNIYIRLDYYKKTKIYKLSWIDLANIDKDNVENIISYEYIPTNLIQELERIINNITINKYEKIISDENKVTITSNFNNHKSNYTFNRYIPKELNILFNIMTIIFDSLPRKLHAFIEELGAEIIGNTNKYEYTEEFNFDLFKDNIDTLFGNAVTEKGKKYYEEGRVFFLEKVKDRYYAVVGGKGLYVIIIKYDSDKKRMQVYCSCPCEFYCKHMYAVIMAIRNKQFRRFYKITNKFNNTNLLDKVMNFNFLLTIGIDDQGNNYLIIEDGELKLLPIINDKGKSDWIILEDDDKETLTKRLNEILK